MTWTILTYPEKSKIVRHALHPRVTLPRIDELRDKYGYLPQSQHERASIVIDPGGPKVLGMPSTIIKLSYGRLLEVADHDLSWLQEMVSVKESDRIKVLGGKTWIRIHTWPGMLVYLSKDDVRRIKAVKPNSEATGEYEAKITAALLGANAAIQAVAKEPDAKKED